MTKFILMIGVPGSGKSTLARKVADMENAVVLSSDELREELFGDVWEFRKNKLLFDEMYRRADRLLSEGTSVVLDATNISRRHRKRILNRFGSFYKECYFINPSLDKVLLQNKKRDRNVPESIVAKMHERLQEPSYNEGWDKINIIR